MCDYIQGLQHILFVFDGCFDNGSQDGKVLGGDSPASAQPSTSDAAACG
jgi:hypothetical protein